MSNEIQTDLFRITNAKVIWLLAAALIFVTTYIANSVINSPHNRIDKLVEELAELNADDRFTIMELTIDHIRDDDKECKERQEALVLRLNALTGIVTSYQAETKQRDENQEKMIDDLRWRLQ